MSDNEKIQVLTKIIRNMAHSMQCIDMDICILGSVEEETHRDLRSTLEKNVELFNKATKE